MSHPQRAARGLLWPIMALALGLTTIGQAGIAAAHGGLPVSQQILFAGSTDKMFVPTPYWGIFVGSEAGPWRWICDEAINLNNQQRRVAIGSDGKVLYATDMVGLTVSTDAGCTWAPAVAPVSQLDVVAVLGDPRTNPAAAQRAYVLANSSSDTSQTGLWQSDNAGTQSWRLIRALGDTLPGGLAISADGLTMAVIALSKTMPRQASLHYSMDGGATFSSRTLTIMTADLDGEPLTDLVPLWFDTDSTQGGALFLRASTSTGSVLFRLANVNAPEQPVKSLSAPTTMGGLARDPQSGQLLLATVQGVYRQGTDQKWTLLGTVSSSQCLVPRGSKLFACAWNYKPDEAAIARLDNMEQTLVRIFQYHQTLGPLDCPAGTPVAKLCPPVWASYADQLGVTLPQTGADMGQPMTQPGSGCQFGAGGAPAAGLGAMALALLGLGLARRRREPRAG